ncbi:MAG: M13 family metallopeptidase [Bacteroidota bacterium]
MKTYYVVTFVILIFSIILIGGCGKPANQSGASIEDILRKDVDTTVNPGVDFFKFANGTWLKNNPIPASESRWWIGNLVQEETYTRLRTISEDAAKEKAAQAGTALQKIGDFYASGIDTAAIDQKGIQPLQGELARIDAIKDIKDLLDVTAVLQTYEVGVLFDFGVAQDQKNSDKMALYVSQGGLGLPNRDYYFNTDARTANIRKEYVPHVARMLQLLGEDSLTAQKHSEAIMRIETDLASQSRKLEDLRDPYKNYNKMPVSALNKLTPLLNWDTMFEKMGVKDPDTVIVGQPEFLKQLQTSLKTVSIDDWKTYLRWHMVNSYADKLSKPFDDENFRFNGTILEGKTSQRDRWKRVLDSQERGLGELLGQLYVQKYFSDATKKRYENLVANILDAYRDRIRNLDWMSATTKLKALAKLDAVVRKVGYPDKWKDYSALSINRDSYVMNVLHARVWEFNYQLNKLGKPVDRMEWDMTPQTYNAYYNPSNNEIVLPAAAFIIPGFPDSLADDAIMYAYAGGSTIGHEITHGFDDEGRQYDAKGNLSNWWTKDDEKNFTSRAKGMIDQFSNYVVLDSMHVNGKATLGENIADLGGVILGYEAFQKTEEAKSGKQIAGFTPNQRYFLGYALSWLGHQRDQRLARQIMTDVHSPMFLRVNGPLSDVPEFYQAFNIKPADSMFRPDSVRVKIW